QPQHFLRVRGEIVVMRVDELQLELDAQRQCGRAVEGLETDFFGELTHVFPMQRATRAAARTSGAASFRPFGAMQMWRRSHPVFPSAGSRAVQCWRSAVPVPGTKPRTATPAAATPT